MACDLRNAFDYNASYQSVNMKNDKFFKKVHHDKTSGQTCDKAGQSWRSPDQFRPQADREGGSTVSAGGVFVASRKGGE